MDTLISFQIKKDCDVTFDKYDEIKKNGIQKKEAITNLIEKYYEKQKKSIIYSNKIKMKIKHDSFIIYHSNFFLFFNRMHIFLKIILL